MASKFVEMIYPGARLAQSRKPADAKQQDRHLGAGYSWVRVSLTHPFFALCRRVLASPGSQAFPRCRLPASVLLQLFNVIISNEVNW